MSKIEEKFLTYSQLLQKSEWKVKRLEIIERDKCCQKCGKISYLQVHHKYYEKDKVPWDYPNEALTTLCSSCHKKEHRIFRSRSEYKYFQTTMNTVEHIEMLTATQYKLTGLLQPYVEFDTNRIDLTTLEKKQVAKSMGIEIRTFYKLFKSLKEAGWIIPYKDCWVINPEYMWAGTIANRATLLEKLRQERLKTN